METLGSFFISKTKFLSFVLDLVGWIIKDIRFQTPKLCLCLWLPKRQKHHKEVKMVTKEKYEFSKIYLAEYCHFDGEDDVKFIVIDINLDKSVITCMLNKTGKFFVQEFDLKTENGDLYFEYNNGSQSAIKTPRKHAEIYCNSVLQPEKIYLENFI